ncbi:MAG: hypothetical protein MHMPM18_001605 [Marteilia pararefringens]
MIKIGDDSQDILQFRGDCVTYERCSSLNINPFSSKDREGTLVAERIRSERGEGSSSQETNLRGYLKAMVDMHFQISIGRLKEMI